MVRPGKRDGRLVSQLALLPLVVRLLFFSALFSRLSLSLFSHIHNLILKRLRGKGENQGWHTLPIRWVNIR